LDIITLNIEFTLVKFESENEMALIVEVKLGSSAQKVDSLQLFLFMDCWMAIDPSFNS